MTGVRSIYIQSFNTSVFTSSRKSAAIHQSRYRAVKGIHADGNAQTGNTADTGGSANIIRSYVVISFYRNGLTAQRTTLNRSQYLIFNIINRRIPYQSCSKTC